MLRFVRHALQLRDVCHAHAEMCAPCTHEHQNSMLRCVLHALRSIDSHVRVMLGSLGSDVTANPDQSSFAKALLHARGTVTVLDSNAVSYKRIWCINQSAS